MIDNLDYDQLDPGIRETVRLIRSWGYETSDSGDGRSKEGVGTDPDILECPHVAVQDPEYQGPDAADDLWEMIEDHFGGEDKVPAGVMVEVTYEARQCSELLMVTGLDDAMLATVDPHRIKLGDRVQVYVVLGKQAGSWVDTIVSSADRSGFSTSQGWRYLRHEGETWRRIS